MTKWISNSETVLQSVPRLDVASKSTVNLDAEHMERALGVSWNVTEDCFTFNFNCKETALTKRGILKVTSSLFDPLGFVTPFILKAKILLQELWRRNYDWDDKVGDDLLMYWKKWMSQAAVISSVKVPRCYSLQEKGISEIQLHVFCGALKF